MNEDISAKTICPMPDHSDSSPSFHITYYEDSGVWIYHCFGCGAKGTIIDFCEHYYDLANANEAVMWICNKYGFKESKDLVIDGLRDIKKKINMQKKIEDINMVNSNSCRMLLRKDFQKHHQWVADIYKKMNDLVEEGSIQEIENIGDQISEKMMEE